MNPSTLPHHQVESSSSTIEHGDVETPLDNNVDDSVGPCAIASMVRVGGSSSSSSSGDLEQPIESYTCDGRPSDQATDSGTGMGFNVNQGDTRPQTPPASQNASVPTHHPHHPQLSTNDDSPSSTTTTSTTTTTTTTASSANNFVSFLGYRCFMVPIVFASILDDDEENQGPVVTIKTSDCAANHNGETSTNNNNNNSSRLHLSTLVPIRIEVVHESTCKITKSQIWEALRVILWLTFILTILVLVSTFIVGNRGVDDQWQSQSPSASPVQP